MPARPIGSATLSFGLVSVPIQLFSTSEAQASIAFNWLHKGCGSRLKQQYVCPKDGVIVGNEDKVKGYEFTKGSYVLFTKDELKALEQERSAAVEIAEFVPAETVDRLWLEKAYYLGPDKGGERAYKLLAEALKATKRAAIGQFAARGNQYLVMIRPLGRGLVMEQLHYADEIRSIEDVPVPEGEVKKAELALATQIIEQGATETFEPAKYEDTVKKRTLESIQRKVEGEEITAEPAAAPETQIIDLMEALKASLAKGAGGQPEAAEEAERKPAKRAPRLKLEKAAEAKPRKVAGRKAS
ncbi:MAG TPA: Ku protein [Gemmatimonadales bacterium]|nr:Ku protein [Gemmatimonadales bacterium]